MLFLAVSAGFLVENQREHYVEHQRAKVFAANLYDELKKDTARLNNLISSNQFVSNKLDTFCLYRKKKTNTILQTACSIIMLPGPLLLIIFLRTVLLLLSN